MNTIHTNHMPEIYRNVANRQVKGGKTESPAFSEQTAHKSESVVLQYKRKHPEDAYHVNEQVGLYWQKMALTMFAEKI